MKTHWISFVFVVALALGSCSPSRTMVEDSPPLAPEDPDMGPPVTGATAAVVASTAIVTGAWKTYDNSQAGYSAKYPADWAVNENVGTNGELITMFMASKDGQGIVVSVLNSDAAVEEIPDMPNTRCQQVTISGLSGRRCFDTLTFNFSTTFISQGKQYAIASSGKHPDQDMYQHFLESFAVTP